MAALPVDYKNLTQAVTSSSAVGTLTAWNHGKARVRLVRIDRSDPKFDRVREVTVEVLLQSDCASTYITGDNSKVVATDTMKNTVFYLSKEHFTAKHALEDFAIALAKHFIYTYDFVWKSQITIVQHGWQRAHYGADAKAAHNTFVRSEPEERTTFVTFHRSGELAVQSGFRGITVLKAGGSSFEGFPRGKLTTLPEATDRTLATSATAKWTYEQPTAKHDFDAIYEKARAALISTVCTLDSKSVQQVLYAACEAILAAVPAIAVVDMHMPNLHLFLFDVARFGIDNNKEIYYPTNEPAGSIAGTVARKKKLTAKL